MREFFSQICVARLRGCLAFPITDTMDLAVRLPSAAVADRPQRVAPRGLLCHQLRLDTTMSTTDEAASMQARNLAKMERVNRWLTECEQSRAAKAGGCLPCGEYDNGETEDLLLRVLVARPRFRKIPTAEEVRVFAGQLRAYHARLWTLDRTRGYFRVAKETWTVPEYPEDIDDVDQLGGWDMDEFGGQSEGSSSLQSAGRNIVVVGRTISPVEEELRDEMIQGYWMLRRKKANVRLRTASVERDFCQDHDAFLYPPGSAAC